MMSPVIDIRPARNLDYAFARDAHHDGYYYTIIKQFGQFDVDEQDARFQESWDSKHPDIILYDGKPCGYLAVCDTEAHIWVDELVLLPTFHNRGIGKHVLKDIIGRASEENKSVRLQVLRKNPAYNFYKKMGFEEYGATDTHFLMQWEQ